MEKELTVLSLCVLLIGVACWEGSARPARDRSKVKLKGHAVNIRFRPAVMIFCAMTVLAAIYIACLQRIAKRQAEDAQRYGRYTAEQILDRTTALAERLCPRDSGWQLSVGPTSVYNGSGKCVKIWDVTCKSAAGRDIAYFTWDAGTGRLLGYSDLRDNPTVPLQPGINAAEAAAAAGDWVRQFNTETADREWRLSGTPGQKDKSWIVSFVATSGHAILEVDRRSGRPLLYRLRCT